MKPEILQKFKRVFEAQKRELLDNNGVNDEEFHLRPEDMKDDIDMTSSLMEQSMKIRLRNRQALYLKKICAAIDRIHAGHFGDCESCEEEIEIKRLEARPTTTLCLNCKEEQEQRELSYADGRLHKSLGKPVLLPSAS